MPGPPPKAPGLRARRNKATTRAKLSLGAKARVPALPVRGCGCGGPRVEPKRKKKGRGRPPKPEAPCTSCDGTGITPWHPLTVAWWRRLWSSPMGPEYIESDVDALYELAALKDTFWQTGGVDSKLAAEIRQRVTQFGGTPLDRRKLEWELERPEPEEESPTAAQAPAVDPRLSIRMVK